MMRKLRQSMTGLQSMTGITLMLTLLLLMFGGGSSQTVQAQRIIVPPGVLTDPAALKIDFHRVDVEIVRQVATTKVDLQFTNTGETLAEGTFLFPLPKGAAVDRLTMFIDGVAYDAKILGANEARSIYDEIVRQYRDPALLEYVGTDVIQANVFPIPAGESRRLQIEYAQLLTMDNGLIAYQYPMSNSRLIDSVSVRVRVQENKRISTVYSPTHTVAVHRDGTSAFTASYESAGAVTGGDFALYYGFEQALISSNLLTYRESATEDGFFLLLVQPPHEVKAETIIPKDVFLVVDQSGSMYGEKWDQARAAAAYVLSNLNPQDRFNVMVFSSGTRIYAPTLATPDASADAIAWLDGLEAEGGTNISAALTETLDQVDAERTTAILFLTDGEATEGLTQTPDILAALQGASRPNARIFTFGVGDSVNTQLLDAIVRDFKGAGSYVRPGQRIDEAVSSLYNKISAPVMTDIQLTFEGITAELLYPSQLSDLFAGEQLTLVGRYRDGVENATIRLTGTVDGSEQTYIYSDLSFPQTASGEPFIARLWANRRIADLLNTIRLNGENKELVDSIVSLSVRYGIITPYTSFLIEEDDLLTQDGLNRILSEAEESFSEMADEVVGSKAVDRAAQLADMASAPAVSMGGAASTQAQAGASPSTPQNALTTVDSKTFIQLNGVWTDTTFAPDTMETQTVVFLSDAYFDLLETMPALAPYFALGDRVIVVVDGVAYEVILDA